MKQKKDFDGLIRYLLDIQADMTPEQWKLLRFIGQHEVNHAAVKADIAQREREREEAIVHALTLPFDKAMPIVRAHINADYKVVFREDVVKWCVANAKDIQIFMDGVKHGEQLSTTRRYP